MCGIVGLFIKDPSLQPRLGHYLGRMLVEMTERGPDSAGVAVYRNPVPEGYSKVTVLARGGSLDGAEFERSVRAQFGDRAQVRTIAAHAVIVAPGEAEAVTGWLRRSHPDLYPTASGTTIEIYKDTGLPADILERYDIASMAGTHALGHTRMATESAVTSGHSHPFSTGRDLCLVHNGSLSNHNRLRERLRGEGIEFLTDNDTEVAAGYLMWRMREGATLDEALEAAIRDLDGFYTFAVGTRDGFAVLRDPIGCKPAVLAETDAWVAMASEFRAIAPLPGANEAKIWEPEPERIYSWERS